MTTQSFTTRLQKLLSSFLIAVILFGRMLPLTSLSAYADDASPTSPPQQEQTSQSQNNAPPPPPSVPTAPAGNNSNSGPAPTVAPVDAVPTVPPVSNNGSQNPPSNGSPPVPTVGPAGATPTAVPDNSSPSPSDVPTVSPTGELSPTVAPSGTSPDTQTGTSQILGTSDSGSPSNSSGTSSGTNTNGSVNDPANTNTGAFSQNQATESLNKNLEQVSQNLADLNNKLNLLSNTGFNVTSLNTLSGNIFTGEANASTNLFNKLNSNVTGVGGFTTQNIYGNQTGDIVFQLADSSATGTFNSVSPTVTKNANTGAGSTNTATTQNGFTVKEANGNDAKLSNDVTLNAISGDNKSVLNTGNGVVKTGDANAVANIINLANTNLDVAEWLFGVINIYGSLTGNIILPDGTSVPASDITSASGSTTSNSQTGAGSDNTAVYQTSDTSAFQNVNTATVATNVDVTSNTGNNASNGNTGGGSVSTGNANADVNSTTVANTNVDDPNGTVWIVMVNELGKWVGKIIGSPSGATTASNLPTSSTSGGDGTGTYTDNTGNSQTGAGSSNNAANSQSSSDSTQNTNNAVINNNVKVNADTGNNAANYNTGAGIVKTGNANAGVNILNLSNLNVKAKKVVVLFINVLGQFVGNVIAPGQPNTHEIIPTQDAGSQVADQSQSSVTPTQAPSNIGGPAVNLSPTPTPEEAVNYVQNTSSPPAVQTLVQYVTGTTQGASDWYYYNYQKNGNLPNYFAYATDPTFFADVSESPIPTRSPLRGVYLSASFLKATESNFPGMLLGGVSLKVNEWWLSIVPLAAFLVILRRRRKIDFSKYLNMLFDIVL